MELKVGDIVYIKSEHFLDSSKRNYMTVTGFYTYKDVNFNLRVIGVWKEGAQAVGCVWFKDNQEQFIIFNIGLLLKKEAD